MCQYGNNENSAYLTQWICEFGERGHLTPEEVCGVASASA